MKCLINQPKLWKMVLNMEKNNIDRSNIKFLIVDSNPSRKLNARELENEKKLEYISKLIQVTNYNLKKSGIDKRLIKKER